MVAKKKRSKRISSRKSSPQIKTDFEIYAQGIKRLKELEKELNLLDTSGFYKDEQIIRARLKNVSDIPIIEA